VGKGEVHLWKTRPFGNGAVIAASALIDFWIPRNSIASEMLSKWVGLLLYGIYGATILQMLCDAVQLCLTRCYDPACVLPDEPIPKGKKQWVSEYSV
jgi:hypothetical protein